MMALSSNSDDIRFIAEVRVSDRTILATYGPRAIMEPIVRKVLHSDRLSDHNRLSISVKRVGFIHYELTSHILYLVVTREKYPQRQAFKLLEHSIESTVVRNWLRRRRTH